MSLLYKVKTATKDDILSHLKACNDNFNPPLSERVDLFDYANRIWEKSVTFEAWENQSLVGMLSAYFNDMENRSGYISNVSITKDPTGKRIASVLLNLCIEYAKQRNFKNIKLEVSKNNKRAIHLYEKFGFHVFDDNECSILMKYEIAAILTSDRN